MLPARALNRKPLFKGFFAAVLLHISRSFGTVRIKGKATLSSSVGCQLLTLLATSMRSPGLLFLLQGGYLH